MSNELPKPPQVDPNETVADTVERVPFLRRFLQSQDDFDLYIGPAFACAKINAYLGYQFLPVRGFTREASAVNQVLLEAWKRGDIDGNGQMSEGNDGALA